MTGPIEIVFVRHGEGEHMLDLPRSLAMRHPRLTEQGRMQVGALRQTIQVTERDLLLASPTPRTIETARILCDGATPRRYVCPVVGPRMFPQGPQFSPLLCDDLLEPEAVSRDFPEYRLLPAETSSELWSGINQIPRARFAEAALELFQWCRETSSARVVIASHDGTIHNYRELLGETGLTRASFLGPAGVHTVRVTA